MNQKTTILQGLAVLQEMVKGAPAKLSDVQIAAWCQSLADYDAPTLREAFGRALKRLTFWPAPVEIRELCLDVRLDIARAELKATQPQAPIEPPSLPERIAPITPEEKAAIHAEMSAGGSALLLAITEGGDDRPKPKSRRRSWVVAEDMADEDFGTARIEQLARLKA